MFKKRYVAAAACALAMVGTANAVQVSRDGTGDFLIAPAYFIGGGMTTDLKVVNTSSTQSVVAKVIFRDPVSSAEIMDFMIYLSPSDVWTATLSCTIPDPTTGNCNSSAVTSNDDSMQFPDENAFISATKPGPIVIQNDVTTGRNPLPNQGYIEVVMGAAYDVAPFRPGVRKTDIVERNFSAPDSVSRNATPNILTGSVTANVPGVGSASLPMVALAGYDNDTKLTIGTLSGLDVANSNTPLRDVEEALWVNDVVVPYAAGPGTLSLATFTFPTKRTYKGSNADNQYQFDVNPAKPLNQRKVCLSATTYDNFENVRSVNISPLGSECVNEFDWLTLGQGANINTGSFTEGWARMNFQAGQIAQPQLVKPEDSSNANPVTAGGTGRVGVPAIVTYMTRTPSSFTWAYAPSSRR